MTTEATHTTPAQHPKPGPGASPARNIRISDDLWESACKKAREQDGESISAIVRSFLREYVRD